MLRLLRAVAVHSKTVCLVRHIQTSSAIFGSIPIKMPALSPTMTEGTIVKWLKKEGDKISPGDVLCEVQTDKAVVGLDLEEEGVLAKIMLPEDSANIKIGTLIAVMVEEGDDWKNAEIPKVDEATSTSSQEGEAEEKGEEKKEAKEQKLIGPSVRNLLDQYGIDSNLVKPSGPKNTLLKGDVLDYIKDHNLKPKDAESEVDRVKERKSDVKKVEETAEYQDIELSNMRKVIAKRLTESKTTIPHVYMSIDCNMNSVLSLRQQFKKSEINVSVNDFVIKAAAIALKKVPEVNSSWNDQKQSASLLSSVDISMAVATPNGLITPIIKNANQLSLERINQTSKELAEKARAGRLQLNEFQGGSFSISNLGMFGITEFIAVINPPQAAILAVGTTRQVLGENDEAQQVMTATMSYDGRVIDEELAAKFLEEFKAIIENPIEMGTSDGSDNRRLNALLS